MRKRGRWSRTAVWSSIGMFTSPNEIEPFQRARAITSSSPLQLLLGLEPVVEILPVTATPLQIPAVRAHPDLFFARFRSHRARPGLGRTHVGGLFGERYQLGFRVRSGRG